MKCSSPAVRRGQFTADRGSVLVLVAVLLLALLGFAALATDIGHLAVVKGELQNAADAGALAGAAQLYYRDSGQPAPPDPSLAGHVNPGANRAAQIAAAKNTSVRVPVEVTIGDDNQGDVERGHWSVGSRTFTPNASLAPIATAGVSDADLDADTGFINAVRVRVHRRDTPVPTFFAQVLNYLGFEMSAEAVAYLGFPRSFKAFDFDWPLAVCEESLLDSSGKYSCGQARLINSSSSATANTGGWTNYSLCSDTAPGDPVGGSSISAIFEAGKNPEDCDGRNEGFIEGGVEVGNGALGDEFNDTTVCNSFPATKNPLKPAQEREVPWEITVPVIDCDGTPGQGTMSGIHSISGCYPVVSAVTLEVVHITDEFSQDVKKRYDGLPARMAYAAEENDDWVRDPAKSGEENWESFVDKFGLKVNGQRAYDVAEHGYYKNTIYARPSCKSQPVTGKTGGINTGVLAALPVLVKGSR